MTGSGPRSIVFALAGVLLVSSVSLAADELPPTGPGLGDYGLVPLLGDGEAYAGPDTPTSLEDVSVSRLVDDQLSGAERARLAEQGFVVVPAQLRLFHEAYEDQYGTGTPGVRDHGRGVQRMAPGLRQDPPRHRADPAPPRARGAGRRHARQRRAAAPRARGDAAGGRRRPRRRPPGGDGGGAGHRGRDAEPAREGREGPHRRAPPVHRRRPSWAPRPTTRCSRRVATTRATRT